MKQLFALLLLFCFKSSLSQVNCLRIVSSDHHPLPYTSVSKENDYFIIADSAGQICSSKRQRIKDGDTIFVSAIGHIEKKIIFHNDDSIMLDKVIRQLPEIIIVNGTPEEQIWGTIAKPRYNCAEGFQKPDQSFGRQFFPEVKCRKAEIQSVAFYDDTRQHSSGNAFNVPVRLRIFLLGKDSLPYADYLDDNIIINSIGKGWLSFDLSDKGLVVPPEGIAVAIELFSDREDFYFQRKIKDKGWETMYGFFLAKAREDEPRTVFKIKQFNRWFKERGNTGCGNLVCRMKVKVWK